MTPRDEVIYDPDWQQKYSKLIVSAQEAVAGIQPGERVFIGTGCAQPQELVRALAARSHELADIEIIHWLTAGAAPYAHKELARHFSVNSFFIAENVRDIIQKGLGDYTPIFLSDIPRLVNTGQLPIDAALLPVGLPDERGMCSLGVSVDIVKCAAGRLWGSWVPASLQKGRQTTGIRAGIPKKCQGWQARERRGPAGFRRE